MHLAVVEFHVDLTRHDNRIVDRVGAMVARRYAGAKAYNAEHRTIGNCGADFLAGGINIAVVVDRESLARPDHAVERSWALRGDVLDHFVDEDLGAALIVVARDNASDIDAHR